MPIKKKRTGRPAKKATPGSRVSLGLKVTAQIKDLLDAQAKASGRTQSQEAEMMIERAIQYDRTLTAMKTTLEGIQRGNIETALREAGWRSFPVRGGGKAWVSDEFLGDLPASGYITPPEKSEE